ncbi:hypothetical protein O181_132479, partial [Austropuccinia psidii MF-1]|nr:hypothetical protein [Austropuccinia psidii MF-1]
SNNVVRQENIETASEVTSIIPASTVNSDHNSTVIIAQNNQPEPIYSELISFYIGNTLQKAKNLANNQKPAIAPHAAPKKVIDMIMAEGNQLQKDKDLKTPQEGSVDISKARKKAYNNALQLKESQILADMFTQWMASIDGKEEHDAFNRIMEEKQPTTTKESAKKSPNSQQQQF